MNNKNCNILWCILKVQCSKFEATVSSYFTSLFAFVASNYVNIHAVVEHPVHGSTFSTATQTNYKRWNKNSKSELQIVIKLSAALCTKSPNIGLLVLVRLTLKPLVASCWKSKELFTNIFREFVLVMMDNSTYDTSAYLHRIVYQHTLFVIVLVTEMSITTTPRTCKLHCDPETSGNNCRMTLRCKIVPMFTAVCVQNICWNSRDVPNVCRKRRFETIGRNFKRFIHIDTRIC